MGISFKSEVERVSLNISSFNADADINPSYIVKLFEENVNGFSPNLMNHFSTIELYLGLKNVKLSNKVNERLDFIRKSCLNIQVLPAGVLNVIFNYLPKIDKFALSQTSHFFNETLHNLSLSVAIPNTSFVDLYKFAKHAGSRTRLLDLRNFSHLGKKDLKKLSKVLPHAFFKVDFQLFYTNSNSIPIESKATCKALRNRITEIDVNNNCHVEGAYIKDLLAQQPECKFNLNHDLAKYTNTEPQILENPEAFNLVVLSVGINETRDEALDRIKIYTDKLSGKIHFIAPPLDYFGTPEETLEFFHTNSAHFVGIQLELSEKTEYTALLPQILSTLTHVQALSLVCPEDVIVDVSNLHLEPFNNLKDLELTGTSKLPSHEVLDRCTRMSFTQCHEIQGFNPEEFTNLISLEFHSETQVVERFPQKIQKLNLSFFNQPCTLNLLRYNSLMHVRVEGKNLSHMFIYSNPALRKVAVRSGQQGFQMNIDKCAVLTDVKSNRIKNIKVTNCNSATLEEEILTR